MSPAKNVHKAVRNYKTHLLSNFSGRFRLPKRADNPFKLSYDPELDISLTLEPDTVACFQTVISVLRWMIKLGNINIVTDMLFLLSHLVLLQEGHLDAVVHVIITYVDQKYKSTQHCFFGARHTAQFSSCQQVI